MYGICEVKFEVDLLIELFSTDNTEVVKILNINRLILQKHMTFKGSY